MRWKACALVLLACLVSGLVAVPARALDRAEHVELARTLQVGDVVFIQVPWLLFRKVGEATGSWTNHVGIVVDTSGPEPVIAESRLFRAGTASLSEFVARSQDGRLALRRPTVALTPRQQDAIVRAAQARYGRWYDTGFDLQSSRQFCSRFVYEVLREGAGQEVGRVQRFSELLAQRPEADQRFWRVWFFGRIPWDRQTITPASQLHSPALETLFDGYTIQS